MKRMRRTFTCLFLLSAVFGIASIPVSCNSAGNKQDQKTDKVAKTDQPVTTSAVSSSVPGPENGQVNKVVQAPNTKSDTNNTSAKMLKDFEKKPLEELG